MLIVLKKILNTYYKPNFYNIFCHKGSFIYDIPEEEGDAFPADGCRWFLDSREGEVADSCECPQVQ